MAMQTTGNNADVTIQSNGTGSKTKLLSTTSLELTAPALTLTGTTTNTGSFTVNGNTVLNGNVTITGTQATVNAAQLNVEDPVVILNSGETGLGVTNGTSGIQFARGQLGSYQLVFKEADQSLQFGPVGSTLAMADKNWAATTFVAKNSTDTLGNLTVTGSLSAGSFSGPLTGNVTGHASLDLPLTGGTLTGPLTATGFSGPLTGAVTGNVTGHASLDLPLTGGTLTGPLTATGFSGPLTGAVTGNASTATTLQTARTINGVSFNGSSNITVPAAAGTLTGATLTSGVTASSLTSVGTLTSLTTSGAANIGTNLTVGGNLVVNGTTTTINAATLDVADLNITVAKNATTAAAANGAGLTVAGANATFNYASANDSWNSNKKLSATSFSGPLTGNVTGHASLDLPLTGGTLTGPLTATGFSGSGAGLTGTASSLAAGSITGQANSATITATSANTANTIVLRDAIGNFSAGTMTAIASQAIYADLAEMYVSDSQYEPGTVLVFGGSKEVTTTETFADVAVAGVVSTAPAYLMNKDQQDAVAVALRGKVPVKVIGAVEKGDLLVTSAIAGYARSVRKDASYPIATFAKALESDASDGMKVITAVII